MRTFVLVMACVFSGCSTLKSSLWGKKVRVTQSEIGLKDPFYVVSKDISPKSGASDFEFPMRIIFNANLYETITIDTGSHSLADLTSGQETSCAIGSGDEEAGKQAKPVSLVFTTAMQGSGGGAPPDSPGTHTPADRPRKEMLLVKCRNFNAPTGHDFRLDIMISQTVKNGGSAPDRGKVSIPFTVSYNGWLVSFLGGMTLTSGFVYLGYLKAQP